MRAQPGKDVFRDARLCCQCFQAITRSFDRRLAGRELLRPDLQAFPFAGLRQSNSTDHPGKRHALSHERNQHNHERQDQYQVAIGERHAVPRRQGDRQRCGQRDDATDPGECQDEWVLPGR